MEAVPAPRECDEQRALDAVRGGDGMAVEGYAPICGGEVYQRKYVARPALEGDPCGHLQLTVVRPCRQTCALHGLGGRPAQSAVALQLRGEQGVSELRHIRFD